jgi:DNA-binding transcriptional ArsR family regulator
MTSRAANRGRLEDERLDRLFHALADRTRRRLLATLAVRPAKVTDLARPFRMSLPAVSKHLRVLEAAGLVSRRVDGRVHRLALRGGPLEAVEVWLDPFRSYWERTLTALEDDLARHPPPNPPERPPGSRHRPSRTGDSSPER